MVGLEFLGFGPPYGLLRYRMRSDAKEEREFKIQVDHELGSSRFE